tara:strand:+ start:6256 stop:7059 length:804 start_codon:yes stop_codon:yes gene_type:complete
MEIIRCPLCNSSDHLRFMLLNDRFDETNKQKFKIVKCDCNFIFLNPRPSENEINKYYMKNYIPHSSKNSYLYELAQKISYYFKHRFLSKNYVIKNILDYGAGNGNFGKYFKNKGYNVTNYDPVTNVSGSLNDKYDMVTMWHSLEHIHNLDNCLKLIYSKMKPNGKLLIAVPNIDASEIKFFKSRWIAFDAPRHLYHFNESSIQRLLNKYDFRISKTKIIIQDTIFNIFMSLKGFYKFLFPFFLIFSFIEILFDNSKASSKLYICVKK